MGLDITSIAILVIAAGLGSVAGYWGRIAQKLEDKRDKTYLTELPAIYSNLLAFEDDLACFNNGGTLDQLITNLKETNKSLQEQIFSADILIFRPELHKALYTFYRDGQNLQSVAELIKDMSNDQKTEQEDTLREDSKIGQDYVTGENFRTNPKDVFNKANEISEKIKEEFSRYHSYSVRLTIIVFILGAFVALIEIIQGLFKI